MQDDTGEATSRNSRGYDSGRSRIRNFLRKLNFNNLLGLGMKPEEAAQRVGVKLRPGQRLGIKDFMNLKSKGEVPEGRKRR